MPTPKKPLDTRCQETYILLNSVKKKFGLSLPRRKKFAALADRLEVCIPKLPLGDRPKYLLALRGVRSVLDSKELRYYDR